MTTMPPVLTNTAAATRLRALLAQQSDDPIPLRTRLIKRIAEDETRAQSPPQETE